MNLRRNNFTAFYLGIFFFTNFLYSNAATAAKKISAKPNQPAQKVPANFSASSMQSSEGQLTGGQKPLEIRGQSRKLEMLQTLKSQSDELDYVKPRKNYKPELGKTLD